MRDRITLDAWCRQNGKEQLLRQWDFEANGCGPADVFFHSQTKYHWVCEKEPGHRWLAAPARRTRHKSTQCPFCSGRFLLPDVNSLAARAPELAAQFDSERNGVTPDRIFSQDNRPFWWRCEQGHCWRTSPNSRAGRTAACPYCSHRRASPEYNLQTEFPWIAEEWVSERNDGSPTDFLPFSEKEQWWRCRFHPDTVWKSKICYHTTGRTSNCPLCRREQNVSFPEQAVYYYLHLLFPDAENRRRIEGWEVDIFLPALRLAIEYDGCYYHKGPSAVETERKKDQALRAAGIRVLRLKEHSPEQPTPPSDDILWQPEPRDYGSGLFLEALMRRLIVWLNEHFDLRLVTRPDIRRDRQAIMSGYLSRRKDNSLTLKAPELVSQWHPTRNGGLRPEQFRPQSNQRVWWRCSFGHEWDALISARTRGTGCPYCAGKRVWEKNALANAYPHVARQWHPRKNAPLTPRDVTANSIREVWWQCASGHVWKRKICYEIKSTGCPYCSGRYASKETSLAGARPDLAAQWHPSRNLPLSAHDLTVRSKRSVWWKCQRGHEWEMDIRTRARGIGNCPYCMGKRVCEENALSTLSPRIAQQWDPEKNGALTPDGVTNHSSQKAWWRCEKGHSWCAVIRSRTIQGAGCPVCAGKAPSPQYNLATEFPSVAEEWDHRKNKCGPEAFLPYSNKSVWWRCGKCGAAWQSRIIDRTRKGRGCPGCSAAGPKGP